MAASSFRVHVTRAVMMAVGLFWASLVAFNLLLKTIRTRGATLNTTERIMEPKALRDQDLGIHNTLKVGNECCINDTTALTHSLQGQWDHLPLRRQGNRGRPAHALLARLPRGIASS